MDYNSYTFKNKDVDKLSNGGKNKKQEYPTGFENFTWDNLKKTLGIKSKGRAAARGLSSAAKKLNKNPQRKAVGSLEQKYKEKKN